jgi:ribosomal protein S18 acetylase RimI-like enzyme
VILHDASMPEPVLRRATAADLPAIVRLLADDELGQTREGADEGVYAAAFAEMARDPNNTIFVADIAGTVAACAQLTVIPGLARNAVTRGQIESVRVASGHRGRRLGRWLMQALIEAARERGCGLVQLTSDNRRPDAHRFYESLGFTASHVGFKLPLR